MQQRKSASSFGRPSGTDGSDFSYRMVVDSSNFLSPTFSLHFSLRLVVGNKLKKMIRLILYVK